MYIVHIISYSISIYVYFKDIKVRGVSVDIIIKGNIGEIFPGNRMLDFPECVFWEVLKFQISNVIRRIVSLVQRPSNGD